MEIRLLRNRDWVQTRTLWHQNRLTFGQDLGEVIRPIQRHSPSWSECRTAWKITKNFMGIDHRRLGASKRADLRRVGLQPLRLLQVHKDHAG